jgi:hypothetical protein
MSAQTEHLLTCFTYGACVLLFIHLIRGRMNPPRY